MSQKIQTSSRMMTISVMTPPPMYMNAPLSVDCRHAHSPSGAQRNRARLRPRESRVGRRQQRSNEEQRWRQVERRRVLRPLSARESRRPRRRTFPRSCFGPRSSGNFVRVIEVREEGAHSAHAAVLIHCAESGGAVGVVRGVDLALQSRPVDRGRRPRKAAGGRRGPPERAVPLRAAHARGRWTLRAGLRRFADCAGSST